MEETPADGNLPATLDRLHTATAALLDPVKEWAEDQMRVAPSLYQQLVDDLPARTGDAPRSRHASSMPPMYVDACDLKVDIDTAVHKLHPDGFSTPHRLRLIAAARWRPQDCEHLERIITELERWAVSIQSLITPQHVKEVSAACPACDVRTVHRRNKAGEVVRQAALQLIPAEGCTCLNCGAFWAPSSYLLLASVLGYAPPAGVDQMNTEEVA